MVPRPRTRRVTLDRTDPTVATPPWEHPHGARRKLRRRRWRELHIPSRGRCVRRRITGASTTGSNQPWLRWHGVELGRQHRRRRDRVFGRGGGVALLPTPPTAGTRARSVHHIKTGTTAGGNGTNARQLRPRGGNGGGGGRPAVRAAQEPTADPAASSLPGSADLAMPFRPVRCGSRGRRCARRCCPHLGHPVLRRPLSF